MISNYFTKYLCMAFFKSIKMNRNPRDGFVKAQSDNLPTIDAEMVQIFFATSDCFNVPESRGVKAKK